MERLKRKLKTHFLTKRLYAFLFSIKYNGLKKTLQNKNEEIVEQINISGDIPSIFYKTPDFISPAVKRAHFFDAVKTKTVLKSYVGRILRGYARYLRATASGTIEEIKNVFELGNTFDNEAALAYQQYIDFLWTYEGASDKFFELCEKFAECDDAYRVEASKIWLMYICGLLENRKKSEALQVLSGYIAHYSLRDIHLYYPVSFLAYENGYCNEKIEKVANVYQHLEHNKDEKEFGKSFSGKTIAVVGSAPFEVGKGKGKEIDEHDIVIRFNNFKTDGFEHDYGSKCNIWARNKDPFTKAHYEIIDSMQLIVVEPDIWHFMIEEVFTDVLSEYIEKYNAKVVYLENRMEFIKQIDTYPTTGGLLLYNLFVNKKEIKQLDVYGFSFLNNFSAKNLGHYYESENQNKEFKDSFMHHDLSKENSVLCELFKKFERTK